MEKLKRGWKKTPGHIRRPFVFVVGIFFVILSGTVGWLPGPGGIPILLLGIAILASEFAWAERLKLGIMAYIHKAGDFLRQHPFIGSLIILLGLTLSGLLIYQSFLRN